MARVLFIVDMPNWAHDYKTRNLMRVLGSELELAKRYQVEVTARDLQCADLILVYSWYQFVGMPRLAQDFLKCRDRLLVGITSHRSLAGERRAPGLRTIRRLAKRVFVNNRLLLEEFAPLFDVPVHYTPNGVDTSFFRPLDSGQAASGFRIGWAGSLTNHGPQKRGYTDFIVPAARAVSGAQAVPAAREEKWRSHEEMRSYYHTLGVYVCASDEEGTPNPCLEAAACGIPVVSTPVGNMPELIVSGRNGFLVERSVEAIREKLQLLKDRPGLRKELAAQMLLTIRAWDWTKQAENYRELIRAGLGER